MGDDVREELQGFAEAWRDDAASCREESDPDRADCYDECAEEIEAFLRRQATPPPAGVAAGPPPAADDEAAKDYAREATMGFDPNVEAAVSAAFLAGLSRTAPRLAALAAALSALAASVQTDEINRGLSGPTRAALVIAHAALGAAGPGGAMARTTNTGG